MIKRNIYLDGMLVVTQCTGTLNSEELNDHVAWLTRSFGVLIKPGFSHLFIAIDADMHNIIEDDIHHIAHINISLANKRGGFTTAIVANEPYPISLAQLHKTLSTVSNINVKIFNNISSAYKWLGYEQP